MRNDLSTAERNSIIHFLLQHLRNGKPGRGKIVEASIKFACSPRTVGRLWAAAKKQQTNNEYIHSTSKKNTQVRGRKVPVDIAKIQGLTLSKRATIRGLAGGIGVQKSTVHRWIAAGLIKPHTSAIKPDLTHSHKLQRVRFSLEALKCDRDDNSLKFQTMHNVVHIDEKWFQITKTTQRFYLTPRETEPHRTCKSKKYITKVMFMCAVARPISNEDGSVLFDGKIGIFPFTELVPAIRTSKNRGAGTMEQKAIQSINMPVIKSMFLNQIVPHIKSKWLEGVSKTIYIQQDNARPHIKDSDPDFRVVASSDGFDLRIVHQPPNSPDMSINDLGWFRAIQSIQHETVCYNTTQLVTAVQDSFEKLDACKLNKVFFTLQSCMLEVLKLKGQNFYKIPHMKNDHLERQGLLPITLEAPLCVVKESVDFLIENGAVVGIDDLIQKLGLNQDTAGA